MPTAQLPSLSTNTGAIARDRAFYRENGYLIMRGLVAGDQLTALAEQLAEMQRHVETGRWRGNHLFEAAGTARVVFGPYDQAPALRELVGSEALVSRAQAFLDAPVQLHHTKIMCKAAGLGTAQPPHQDYYYWQGSKPNQVAVFVCIDPSTVANGCLRVIPGSHHGGLREHCKVIDAHTNERHWVCDIPEELRASEIEFVAEPGDAIFFGSLTVHHSMSNTSGRPRRAVVFEYDELRNLQPVLGWGAPIPAVEWTNQPTD